MRISGEFVAVPHLRRIGTFLNSAMLFPRPRISGPAAGDTKANSHIVEIPKMIDVPGRPFRIMQSEATVGLFKQLADAGCDITDRSNRILSMQLKKGTSYDNPLTNLNLFDGRALANAISKQLGGKFRLPAESELQELRAAEEYESVRKQLSGKNWEWTDTTYLASETSQPDLFYILLSFVSPYRIASKHEDHYPNYTVRLVEDI